MRKYLIAALLIIIALPSTAQEKKKESSPFKHEINVSWGWGPEEIQWEFYDFCKSGNNGLDFMYGNYIGSKKATGLISVDYNIQFKRWFALGVQANAFAISNTEISSITEKAVSKYTDYFISALPYARFTYLNRKYVKLYSSIGVGLGFYHDAKPIDTDYTSERINYMRPCGQFVPIGIMVGNKVYGMAELGTGTEYNGFRIGVGFRF